MAITGQQKHKLKKFIKDLSRYRGRHTELVSVYIPQGYDINKIIQHLSQESGTATNIKDAITRKNVITALEKMIQHLRLFKKTPENGLVAFSGNIAAQQGKQDFNVWSIEPPVPLKTRIYMCDKKFILDILEDMLETKEVYGLIVLDRRDADIAYLKGKAIIPLQKTHSEVPGKIKAGGQSAKRYAKNTELAAKAHYKKVAEYVKNQFLENKNLKGILVGGPGPTKYEFVEGGFVTNELRKRIIAIKDLSYTGEFGLQELVDKAEDVLAKEDIMAEKKVMGRFFDLLAKKPGMASYGEKEVMQNLKNGSVEVLLLSEKLEEEKIEEFEREAGLVGSQVTIVSTETREGVQLRDLGKVAAILRYEVQ
ncbi:peptide chain release factor aRF-1 [Candidatus Woesearchaeota archaeon]|nr:peptide chain release factor aRF-1 [Candidatus Woesearchaeota archaeon]